MQTISPNRQITTFITLLLCNRSNNSQSDSFTKVSQYPPYKAIEIFKSNRVCADDRRGRTTLVNKVVRRKAVSLNETSSVVVVVVVVVATSIKLAAEDFVSRPIDMLYGSICFYTEYPDLFDSRAILKCRLYSII